MEQKLQNRYGRWGRALTFALALALAALLSLTALPLTGRVYAEDEPVVPGAPTAATPREPLDWDKQLQATLQLKLPENLLTDEVDRDFLERNLQVDIYKIADAVPVDGYDIYAYKMNDQLPNSVKTGIEGFLADHADVWKTASDESFRYVPDRSSGMILDDGSVAELAKLATELIFNAPETVPEVGAAEFSKEHGVDFGLYVVMPHSAIKMEEYQVKVPVKDSRNEYNPATLAIAPHNVYTFSPQLISVPSLGGLVTDTAADGTQWEYNVTAVAKPEEQPRYATLQLTKTLSSYNGPAVFVFDISAVLDGEMVFEKQVAFNFTGAGEQSVTIEGRIPAGSEVTVEEVYSGAAYSFDAYKVDQISNDGYLARDPMQSYTVARPVGSTVTIPDIVPGNVAVQPWTGTGEIVIATGDTVAIAATNAPNGNSNQGGGVVNRFDKGTGGTDWYGWNWTQDYVVPAPTAAPQQ